MDVLKIVLIVSYCLIGLFIGWKLRDCEQRIIKIENKLEEVEKSLEIRY